MRYFACLGFLLLTACAQGEDNPPEEAPSPATYICPAMATLNCMPIVPPERQQFCAPAYRDWITTNCPGVEIVY